jgi:predicted N-formylglutamate amidohydrolase
MSAQTAHDMMSLELLITCEHGGNRVPRGLAAHFASQSAKAALASHRGWDPGALELARRFAKQLVAPLLFSTVSRLVVELNRSPRHRRLFSEFMADVPAAQRQAVVIEHYQPHRQAVLKLAQDTARRKSQVLHVSVHTFTPVLDGADRLADVGLLYDPARRIEGEFCGQWLAELRAARPDWTVRRNYPYLGKTDGLVTTLRRAVGERNYLGIELEVNQKHPLSGGREWSAMQRKLVDSFVRALNALRDR